MAGAATSRRHARTLRIAVTRIVPVIAALALGLTLSACDRCGDFFWEKPGACKSGPAPSQ